MKTWQQGLTLMELLMAMALSSLVASAMLHSISWLVATHQQQNARITSWERELVVRQTFQHLFRRLSQGLPWSSFDCVNDPSAQADSLLGAAPSSLLSVTGSDDDSAPSRAVRGSDVITIRHFGCAGYVTEQYFVGRHSGGKGDERFGLYFRERRGEERWGYSQEIMLGLPRITVERCESVCQPARNVPGFHSAEGLRLAFHWHEDAVLPFPVSYLTLVTTAARAVSLSPGSL